MERAARERRARGARTRDVDIGVASARTRGAAEEQTRGALRLGEEACGDRVEVQCRQCQLGARHVACGIHPRLVSPASSIATHRDARVGGHACPRRVPRVFRAALAHRRRCVASRARVVVRAASTSSAPAEASSPSDDVVSGHKPRVAVVGAGWGGFGAAKALCEAGCDVTLLDGIPDPTGATPSLTPTGKPFEYGTRGFWKDYPNIEAMLAELGVDESDVFSDFTPSSFFSPDGLEATAPVFSSSDYLQLPSPLGQVFATFDNFKRLPLEDRASMAGLLYAMLDLGRDDATFRAYDRMTAHDLFIRMGLSKRLVDDFIRPTLLVGLFKPPEELSAAVTMELLYYYALAHQDSFDVRWIARGTVQSALVRPLAAHLTEKHHLTVLGGCASRKSPSTRPPAERLACRTRREAASATSSKTSTPWSSRWAPKACAAWWRRPPRSRDARPNSPARRLSAASTWSPRASGSTGPSPWNTPPTCCLGSTGYGARAVPSSCSISCRRTTRWSCGGERNPKGPSLRAIFTTVGRWRACRTRISSRCFWMSCCRRLCRGSRARARSTRTSCGAPER